MKSILTTIFFAALGALTCEATEHHRTIIPHSEPPFTGTIRNARIELK
jgi:hypothetical protein